MRDVAEILATLIYDNDKINCIYYHLFTVRYQYEYMSAAKRHHWYPVLNYTESLCKYAVGWVYVAYTPEGNCPHPCSAYDFKRWYQACGCNIVRGSTGLGLHGESASPGNPFVCSYLKIAAYADTGYKDYYDSASLPADFSIENAVSSDKIAWIGDAPFWLTGGRFGGVHGTEFCKAGLCLCSSSNNILYI